jgi:1,4-alpha-glucan branching enzyme
MAPVAAAPRAGATRFVFVAPNAQHVALVGDFNLWNPANSPMQRIAGTDAWAIDIDLPAGRHVYAFVVDGDVTADPAAPRTAGDDFGRPNSVVLVSPHT